MKWAMLMGSKAPTARRHVSRFICHLLPMKHSETWKSTSHPDSDLSFAPWMPVTENHMPPLDSHSVRNCYWFQWVLHSIHRLWNNNWGPLWHFLSKQDSQAQDFFNMYLKLCFTICFQRKGWKERQRGYWLVPELSHCPGALWIFTSNYWRFDAADQKWSRTRWENLQNWSALIPLGAMLTSQRTTMHSEILVWCIMDIHTISRGPRWEQFNTFGFSTFT